MKKNSRIENSEAPKCAINQNWLLTDHSRSGVRVKFAFAVSQHNPLQAALFQSEFALRRGYEG